MALMCWPSVAVAALLAHVLLCAVAEQLGHASLQVPPAG